MRKMMCLKAVGVVSAFALSATAADSLVYWQNAEGGDYSTAANWSGANCPPLASDYAYFGLAGTYEVDFSQDVSSHGTMFCNTSAGDAKVTVDLKGRQWFFPVQTEWGDAFYVWSASSDHVAEVTVKNGVVSNFSGVCVGYSVKGTGGTVSATASGAHLVMTGAGTVFHGRNDDVKIGVSASNVLEVLDGAYLHAGRALQVSTGSDNVFRISGAGSRFHEAGNQTVVNGSRNLVEVSAGGLYDHEKGAFMLGNADSAQGNVICVSSGGCLQYGGLSDLSVGKYGTNNVLRITGAGSRLLVPSAKTVVGCAKFDSIVGSLTAVSNRLEVLDGAVSTNSSSIYCGVAAGAEYNGVVVSNATLYTPSRAYVNDFGRGNYLKVCGGGAMRVNHHLCLAYGSAASDGLIEACDEGTTLDVSLYDLNIGVAGPRNGVYVHDGAFLNCYRSVLVGAGAVGGAASNNWFTVFNAACTNVGPQSSFICKNRSTATFGGSRLRSKSKSLEILGQSTLRFVFDEDGIRPHELTWWASFQESDTEPSGGKIVIDATRYVKGPNATRQNEFTVLKGTEAFRLGGKSIDDFIAEDVTVLPENAKYELSVDAAKSTITIRNVRISTGLRIILR